jgi:hypothetical protein
LPPLLGLAPLGPAPARRAAWAASHLLGCRLVSFGCRPCKRAAAEGSRAAVPVSCASSLPFKICPDLEPLGLPRELPESSVAATEVLAGRVLAPARALDLAGLARLLFSPPV